MFRGLGGWGFRVLRIHGFKASGLWGFKKNCKGLNALGLSGLRGLGGLKVEGG